MQKFPEIITLSLSLDFVTSYWGYIHTVERCPLARKIKELFHDQANVSVYRTTNVVVIGDLQAEYRFCSTVEKNCYLWGNYGSRPIGFSGYMFLRKITVLRLF